MPLQLSPNRVIDATGGIEPATSRCESAFVFSGRQDFAEEVELGRRSDEEQRRQVQGGQGWLEMCPIVLIIAVDL